MRVTLCVRGVSMCVCVGGMLGESKRVCWGVSMDVRVGRVSMLGECMRVCKGGECGYVC